MSNDLENFLKSVANAVQLLRDELSVVSTLRAEMDLMRTEHKQMNDVLQNYGKSVQEFSEIAFDENKFTESLLERCEEAAREAAKEEIDIDEIASEVQDNIDVTEDVRRVIDRMDLITEDKVNDLVETYINDNTILNSVEVDNAIEDYLLNNDYIQRDDVDEIARDAVNDIVDERTENVARRIVKEELAKLVHQMMHAVVGTPQLIKEESSHELSVTNGTQPQQPNA